MSFHSRLTLLLVLTGGSLISTGCSTSEAITSSESRAATGRPLQIVTTTGMVNDLVRTVAGDHAELLPLMGPGIDPHLFKPTRNDVKKLFEADVVFYSGLMLEHRMEESLEQLAHSGHQIFAVTQKLDPSRLRSPPDFAGQHDPHVWMDVALWSDCLPWIAEKLSEADPAHAAEFQQNAKAAQEELRELDEYCRTVIQSIPEGQRVLVTAHDAFGYFGQRYGLEVRSVQGVTTESEAGIQDVNALVDFLVERKLPAIFVESSVNSKNIQAVIEGCRSRGVTVKIGGELYSDAMGAAGTYEGTYLGMLDANATRIARALGGNPPERGFKGQLAD
ncbi:MAG TPA: zinc ABC transporter substrate-binding protein [Planctomycetaceae bacterium]|nr:zinc ABC transporter substrate-binding protein [Planctomycetaceae bacterium]